MSVRRMLKTMAAVVFSIIGIVIILQTICYFRLDDEHIRNDINALFMGRLGKAVKFDSARVYFWGRMSLSNFTLSRSSDFNDNLPLLKCESAVVRIRLIDLLRKKVSVKSIEIEGGTVSLQKQSDEGTGDFLNSLFPDKDLVSGASTSLDFDMILDDVSLNLKIFTDNEVVTFQAENISSTIQCKTGSASWEMEGDVLPRIQGLKKGEMRTEGTVYLRGNRVTSGKAALGISNMDLRYFSPLIDDKLNTKVVMSGLGDFSSVVSFAGKSISFANTCVMNDFRVIDSRSNRKIVNRDMIAVHAGGEYIDGGKYRIRSFSANDGNVSMRGSGVLFIDGETVKRIAGKIRIDSFDLNDFALSYPVSVFAGRKISGSFGFEGYLSYDRGNGICDLMKGSSETKKLSLFSGTGEGAVKIFEGNTDAVCDNESVMVKSSGTHLGEPFEVDSRLFIRKIRPFSTALTVNADFRQGSLDFLASFVNDAVGKFYKKVYDDRRGGYEDIKFLETFVGRMLNNNDIDAKLAISNITVGTNKKGFSDLKAVLAMTNGTMKFELASLMGYGGKYSLSGDGFLHTDYPQIKISGSAVDLNVANYASDCGEKGIKDGKASLTFQYSMNGNRLAHFVDNGTVDLTADVSALVLENNGKADSFAKYMRKHIPSVDFASCAITQGGIAYHQTGENGFIQKFTIASDRGNIGGFGKYSYEKGLNISGEFSTSGAGGAFASVPFDITGTLAKPVFAVRVKNPGVKKNEGFELF